MEKHRKVFDDKPGLCKIGEHEIRLKENEPIPRRKLYPVPFALRDEVDRQITELLAAGIIEPSNSPYIHPIVCVKKKTGDIRIAVDYKAINSITVTDAMPMMRMNELLFEVGKAKYISCLDASSGFLSNKFE